MEWMIMPLRRYAEFSGRSRRQEFWVWQLLKVLVSLVFMIVIGIVFGVSIASVAGSSNPASVGAGAAIGMGVGLLVYLVMLILGLAVLVPDIAVSVRRLHDTDRSGLWLLSVIGCYVVGYVLFLVGAMAQSSAIAVVGGIALLGGFVVAVTLLVFMCLPGTIGPNRYGADPLAGERGAMGMTASY